VLVVQERLGVLNGGIFGLADVVLLAHMIVPVRAFREKPARAVMVIALCRTVLVHHHQPSKRQLHLVLYRGHFTAGGLSEERIICNVFRLAFRDEKD
jgi:hypothetical protein